MSEKAVQAVARQFEKIGTKNSFLLISADESLTFTGTVSLKDLEKYKTGIDELIEYRKKRMKQLGKSETDRTNFLCEKAGSIYSTPVVSNVANLLQALLQQLNNSVNKDENVDESETNAED